MVGITTRLRLLTSGDRKGGQQDGTADRSTCCLSWRPRTQDQAGAHPEVALWPTRVCCGTGTLTDITFLKMLEGRALGCCNSFILIQQRDSRIYMCKILSTDVSTNKQPAGAYSGIGSSVPSFRLWLPGVFPLRDKHYYSLSHFASHKFVFVCVCLFFVLRQGSSV